MKVSTRSIPDRVAHYEWERISAQLDEVGWAPLSGLLTDAECREITALYANEQIFRSRVVMARHGYGRGEYKYFAYPLPAVVAELRVSLYARLAPIANRWSELLASDERYPDSHEQFIERCHRAGQARPTPLVLSYGLGDYN